MALTHVTQRFGTKGSSVLVTLQADGGNASLFSDAAGTVPLPNPVTVTANGHVDFYVAVGTYVLTESGNGTDKRTITVGSTDGDGGPLALRPTAAAFGRGFYFANDDNGGTLYHSDGVTWTKWAPGVAEPAGLELGYAEIVAAPAAITSGVLVDIAGLSVTVTVGVRPIRVLVNIDSASNNTAAAATQFAIVEGAATKQTINGTSGVANAIVPIGTFGVRLAPTPGQHTYKVQWARVFAGTSSVSIGTANPASIQVVTC